MNFNRPPHKPFGRRGPEEAVGGLPDVFTTDHLRDASMRNRLADLRIPNLTAMVKNVENIISNGEQGNATPDDEKRLEELAKFITAELRNEPEKKLAA